MLACFKGTNSPAFVGVTEKNGENIDVGVADLLALMPSW
jgi:hypothetical protein